MASLVDLRAREKDLEREWTRLNTAINQVVRVLADREDAHAFHLTQRQIMAVGQRRVELIAGSRFLPMAG
jgi:hypothetical protein